MKIALVEPDEMLADLVSFRLELLGHEVIVWRTGGALLSELPNATVDFLIVDTFQTDMQGWEAISRVRKSHTAEDLPIMALSVDTDLSLVEKAYIAGANEYLITPFDPTKLQEKTEKMLLQRQESVHSGK